MTTMTRAALCCVLLVLVVGVFAEYKDKREDLKEATYTLEDLLGDAIEPNFELNLEKDEKTGVWAISFDQESEKGKVLEPSTTLWKTGAEWMLTATPIRQLLEFIDLKNKNSEDPVSVLPPYEICDLARRWEPVSLQPVIRSLPEHRRRPVLLTLCVIHETRKGVNSRWAPWVASFPSLEDIEQPIAWGDDDIAFLQSSPVVQAAKSAREEILGEYQKLTDLFTHPSKGFTEEDYLRAALFVLSNIVDVPIGESAPSVTGLLPALEMAECSLDPSRQITFRFSADENKILVLSPPKALPTSEKIYRRCGQSNTAQSLFLNYGKFPPDDESHNFVEFLPLSIVNVKIDEETKEQTLSLANEEVIVQLPEDKQFFTSPLLEEKLKILKENDLENVAIIRESIDPLLITFRLLYATEAELHKKGNIEKILKGKSVGKDNDMRTVNALQNTLLAILSTYPTMLQEDQAVLEEQLKSSTRRPRLELALRLTILEKSIYETSLKNLSILGSNYGLTTFTSLSNFFQHLEENNILF